MPTDGVLNTRDSVPWQGKNTKTNLDNRSSAALCAVCNKGVAVIWEQAPLFGKLEVVELFELHVWSTLPLELVGEEVLIQELDEGDLFISWTKKFCQCTKQTIPSRWQHPRTLSPHSQEDGTGPSTDQALSPNLQGIHQHKQPLGTATKPWWQRHMEVDEIPSPTRTFKQLQYEERIVNVDHGSFCPLVFSTSGAIAPP